MRATGVQTIVLDLSQLDFIDSTGVHLLLDVTFKSGYGSTSEVLLTRGPEHIHRVLRIAGAEHHLPFINWTSAARKASSAALKF